MTSPAFARLFAVLAALAPVLLSGCLSQQAPKPVRYFMPRLSDPQAEPAPASGPALRIGLVTAAPHLRGSMVRRISENEVWFDGRNRWAALPARLVEEALHEVLVCRMGFRISSDRDAPLLEVHVKAFELDVNAAQAVVELRGRLVSGGRPSDRHLYVQSEEPVDTGDPAAAARALGSALVKAVHQLGRALREADPGK